MFAAVARQLRISAKIIFFRRKEGGWGSERGRGPAVRAVILSVWRKKRVAKK